MAMGSGQMLVLPFLIILFHFSNIITAQLPGFLYSRCRNSGANYTTNSTYQTNLETILSSLPSGTSNNYGFYNTSAGQGNDIVNAITLCRGDVSREICHSCVSNATLKIREVCPNRMTAIGFYELCMVRYTNASIFQRVDGDVFYFKWTNKNITSVGEFNAALRNLTNRLQTEASVGGSLRKFATGNITGPDSLMIHALMQCTPDLSVEQCRNCLYDSRELIPRIFNGKQGGRVIRPSCSVRYELYSFYNEIPAIPLPTDSSLPPLPPPDQLGLDRDDFPKSIPACTISHLQGHASVSKAVGFVIEK